MCNLFFRCICLGAPLSLSSLYADSALDQLMQGNQRYVTDLLQHPNRTSERREAVVCKQEPFAIIVGCSDSRVSPEIVFDQGVGDLFVVRVAGNVIGDLELESILYAAVNLHARVILVLGHESCGAVQAVVENKAAMIPSIARLIEPSVEAEKKKHSPPLLAPTIQENALRMAALLEQNPTLQKLVVEKKLEIKAGYYNLQTGKVNLLTPLAS